VKRYLIIELLKELLGIREDVIIFKVLLSTFAAGILFPGLLFVSSIDHGLVLGQRRKLVVVVVAIELGLNRVPTQVLAPLNEIGVIEILPLLADVLLVVVVVSWRDERCSQLFLVEVLPWEVREPGVPLDILAAVVAESVLWLPLDHLVDEISGLDAPSDRHFLLLNLYLLRQNVVSDFFPRFPDIGPLSVHAFVGHYSYSEIVHSVRVVLSAHHFGSHVAWGSRGVLSILLSPVPGDSEISDSQVALIIDDQVLRLDVSVDNLFIVAVLETSHQACNEETYKKYN
jgi:hypothetical protein